ncbi:TRAP-type C4-dicarboxylate transport system substrate-binding protein [Rhizobium sp. AG855]|nr:TRAP-type C4-dicarboxylate transport system substrate-binding protein [Rhizobium sp. AG855]
MRNQRAFKSLYAAATAGFAATVVISIGAGPALAQEVTIKIADSLPAEHLITKYTTNVFMEKLKAEFGDRIKFEHYPAQQLGKASDMLTLTQAGIADIGYIGPSYVSEKMPLSNVADLPGIASSSCEATLAFYDLVTNGGMLDEAEFKPNGIRVIYNVAQAPYQAVFSKRAGVAKLADFAGKKIRANAGAMELTLQSTASTAVRMAPPEIFDAMSKGTVDGALLPFASMFSYGLDQIAGSSTQGANFGTVGVTFSMSQAKWDALPKDMQEAFARVGREVTESGCHAFDVGEAELARKLAEEGATVFKLSPEDTEALNTKMEGVTTDWAKLLDGRGQKGSEALSAYREAVKAHAAH